MDALNQEARTRVMWHCMLTYLASTLLVFCILYFQFAVIPKIYSAETAITNDKIEELVKYTNDADSLVMQIQKAKNLEAKSLVPFYNWTNNLKAVYKQPFYESIITSYADLVNDIAQANGADTTLISLKQHLVSLQRKNLELMRRGDELKTELNPAKGNQ